MPVHTPTNRRIPPRAVAPRRHALPDAPRPIGPSSVVCRPSPRPCTGGVSPLGGSPHDIRARARARNQAPPGRRAQLIPRVQAGNLREPVGVSAPELIPYLVQGGQSDETPSGSAHPCARVSVLVGGLRAGHDLGPHRQSNLGAGLGRRAKRRAAIAHPGAARSHAHAPGHPTHRHHPAALHHAPGTPGGRDPIQSGPRPGLGYRIALRVDPARPRIRRQRRGGR